MNFYDEVMKAERQRTLNYGADLPEEGVLECPMCGSCEWDFLLKDCHGDFIGCQECVSKIYPSELDGLTDE